MNRFVLALTLGLSVAAFAEGSQSNGSQFQHQTAAGSFELTPDLVYLSESHTLTGVKYSQTNFAEGLVAEYGLSPMFSVGLALSLSDVKLHNHSTSKDTKSTGLNDLDLYLNGRTQAGPGSFRFGTHVFVSPDSQKKIDSSGNINAASGGETLTPFIGYEINAGTMTYGTRIKYDVYKTKATYREEDRTPVAIGKLKDGNELKTSVFAEGNFSPVTLGASFSVVNQKSLVIEMDPDSVYASGEYEPSSSRVELNIYAAYLPESWVTILPTLGYLDWTADNTSSKNGFFAALGARFEF